MIKVKVTQKHIDEGKMGLCRECPIALALLEQGFPDPWVDDDWLVLNKEEDEIKYPLPRSAILFICDFDDGHHVDPFEFRLVKKILPRAIDLSNLT